MDVVGTSAIASFARRLDRWRDEPWPLLPWNETPAGYRRGLALLSLAKIGIVSALWAWTRPELHVDGYSILIPALAITIVSGMLIHRSSAVTVRFDAAPVLALSVALHPFAAGVCAVVSRVGSAIRKPLPRHLVAANVLDLVCSAVAVACCVSSLSSRLNVHSTSWMVGVLASIIAVESLTALGQHLVARAGGYLPSWRATIHSLAVEIRSFALAEAPLVLMVGVTVAIGPPIAIVLLLAPRLISFDLGKHTDMLVEARIEATHDPLTGLHNRRSLDDVAADLFPVGDSGADCTWVLMCDLDDFKHLNDTLGHDAGDLALVDVADRIRSSIRASDHCARLGGEEFTVIVCGADGATIAAIAERIRSRVEHDLADVGITVSIGVHRARSQDTLETALKAADAAMYRSKQSGKNRVTFDHLRGLDADRPAA